MSIFKPNLFEKFEIRGEWWLPGKLGDKVAGTVEYDPQTITLTTQGSVFGGDVPAFYSLRGDHKHPAVINGLSLDGELVTLLDNLEISSSWSSAGGTGTIRYRSNYLIRGEHFATSKEMLFESCSVSYTFLEEWVGKKAFETEFITENDKIVGETAAYRIDDSFDIWLPSINARMVLKHRVSHKGGDWFRTLGWEHIASINITPKEKPDFFWYRSNIFRLRTLFSLFIGVPIQINAIELQQDQPVGGNSKPSVYLYLSQNTVSSRPHVQPGDVIVRLNDVLDNLSTVVNLWFEKYDDLETVHELFFSTVYAERLYVHLHFLSLTQALETFHRLSRQHGTYLSNVEYEEIREVIVKAIPSNVPAGLKASLKSRLKYGNEYSQRKRFSSLLNELDSYCLGLVTGENESFINSIVDTRNYLTHYSVELKDKALEGADLYNANLRLRVFLIILLLREIGIPNEKVVQLIQRNRKLTDGWVHEVEFFETSTTKEPNT